MIGVTGATGQLGRRVVTALLKTVPPCGIAALARNVEKAGDLASLGVTVRQADYDRPETLPTALAGVETLLLISGNEIGRRVSQHEAVIRAAERQKVRRLAYTSILHADTTLMAPAPDHRETEAALLSSGVPYVLLRHGWYTENFLARIPGALQTGKLVGSAGNGRIASAMRDDFAAAAAAVLTSRGPVQRIYELAGDTSWSLTDLAAEISHHAGRKIVYQDLPEAEAMAAMISAGMSERGAKLTSRSDPGIAAGGLFDEGKQISRLTGRPTLPMEEAVAQWFALNAAS